MARTLDSVQVQTHTNPPATRSSSTSTACTTSNNRPAPKLRDSCQACSASKVKCNKKKPTCERCEKRGLACEYLVTRRAGRTKQRHSEPRISSAFLFGHGWTPSATTSGMATVSPVDCVPKLMTPSHMSFDGVLAKGPSDSSSTSPLDPFQVTDFFGSSGITFATPETMDFDPLGHTTLDFSPTQKDQCFFDDIGTVQDAELQLSMPHFSPEESFLSFEELKVDCVAASATQTSRKPRTSQVNVEKTEKVAAGAATNGALNDSSIADCSGFCLSQATTLLQQLFENLSASGAQSPAGSQSDESSDAGVESVLSKNKQTIETVRAMLSCTCSRDAYLLAIMSLIVFKVIGWYASVARETAHATMQDHPISSDSACFQHRLSMDSEMTSAGEEDDYGRRTGQAVLSELHCVQRLVNQLSRCLKDESVRHSTGPVMGGGLQESARFTTWAPISSAMLDQIEMDLRAGLRSLSTEIVTMLRRE